VIFDVAIIGGGPAGATAGGLLARAGFKVLLCEGKPFPREKVCGEFMGTRVRSVLARLELLHEFDRLAGPPVRRVAACVGEDDVEGIMPPDSQGALPRALGRGTLDELLLNRARSLGATVWQPCHVVSVAGNAQTGFRLQTNNGEVAARTIVLAHGLPQKGALDGREHAPLRRQYVCFKAHFAGCALDEKTIAIAGGQGIYAGLVKTSADRYSIAFVVHRSRIEQFGNTAPLQLAALRRENAGFHRMIGGSTPCGPWHASGPLEPGVRCVYDDGRFFVGNAAGEVHALVGEGITLAMRGGELLADILGQHGLDHLDDAGTFYEKRWRSEFARRYAAAQVFANLMMRPALAGMAGRVLNAYPELMDACIRQSGK
jgi:flavin-dependent dehydrogenase